MILDPINDGECLGQLVRIAREQARTSTAYNLAARLRTTDGVVRWLQSLPQRDDDGRETLQVIQCDVPQRVRLFPSDPNCFERTLAALVLLEVIDPKTPRVAVTIEKPLRHTALAELVGGQWRVVDLFPRRNGKPVITSTTRNAAGVVLAGVGDPEEGPPQRAPVRRTETAAAVSPPVLLGLRRNGTNLPSGWRDPFAEPSPASRDLPPGWRDPFAAPASSGAAPSSAPSDPWAPTPEQEALWQGRATISRGLPPPPPAWVDELHDAQRWGAHLRAESEARTHYRDESAPHLGLARNLSAQDMATGKQVVGVLHGIGKGILGAFGMGQLGDMIGQGWQAAGLLDPPAPASPPSTVGAQTMQATTPPASPPSQPSQPAPSPPASSQPAPSAPPPSPASIPPPSAVVAMPSAPPSPSPSMTEQGGSTDARTQAQAETLWWPPRGRSPRAASGATTP